MPLTITWMPLRLLNFPHRIAFNHGKNCLNCPIQNEACSCTHVMLASSVCNGMSLRSVVAASFHLSGPWFGKLPLTADNILQVSSFTLKYCKMSLYLIFPCEIETFGSQQCTRLFISHREFLSKGRNQCPLWLHIVSWKIRYELKIPRTKMYRPMCLKCDFMYLVVTTLRVSV